MSEKLNRYICSTCRKAIVTIDRDKGVTAFAVICRATPDCQGMMTSSFYRGVTGTPTYEWRKHTPEEYAAASDAMKAHFAMGGLDIHKI